MKQFGKIYIEDRKISMIQDNLANAINPLLSLPLSSSNLIPGVELESGNNTINHGLGRNLIGWIITRKDANEDIFDNQDSNTTPALTLILNSSGDVRVDIIVF